MTQKDLRALGRLVKDNEYQVEYKHPLGMTAKFFQTRKEAEAFADSLAEGKEKDFFGNFIMVPKHEIEITAIKTN